MKKLKLFALADMALIGFSGIAIASRRNDVEPR